MTYFVTYLALGAAIGYYIMFVYKLKNTELENERDEILEDMNSDTGLTLLGFAVLSLICPLIIPLALLRKIIK